MRVGGQEEDQYNREINLSRVQYMLCELYLDLSVNKMKTSVALQRCAVAFSVNNDSLN